MNVQLESPLPGPAAKFRPLITEKVNLPGATKAELREVQSICDNLTAQLSTCDNGSAKREIRQIRADYEKDPSEAGLEKLKNSIEDPESLHEQKRLMRRAIKGTIEKVHVEKAAPLVRPIFLKVVDVLTPLGDSIEEQEKSAAELVGLPHEPSNSLRAIRRFIAELRSRAFSMLAPDYKGSASPKAMLDNLIDF